MEVLSVAGFYLLTAVLLGSMLAVALQGFLSYCFDRALTRSVLLTLFIFLIPLWKMVSKETSRLIFDDFSFRQLSQSFLLILLVFVMYRIKRNKKKLSVFILNRSGINQENSWRSK